MPRRSNDNLTPDELAVKRALAERHGYIQARGPGKGRGSVFGLELAIVHGDVALTSIDPDDRQALAAWLREQTPPVYLTELVEQLASDLTFQLERSEPPPPTTEESPDARSPRP